MEQMDKDGKWIVSPSTEDQKFNSWKSGRRTEERLPVFRLVLVFLSRFIYVNTSFPNTKISDGPDNGYLVEAIKPAIGRTEH